MNHTVDEFYSEHNYPPWMKQKNNHIVNVVEKDEEYETGSERFAQGKIFNDQIVKTMGAEQL